MGYDLHFAAGIAQGHATLGRIGFEGRSDYAAIGSVTNLAARLCAEATRARSSSARASTRDGASVVARTRRRARAARLRAPCGPTDVPGLDGGGG
jgi:class 3 adenylate cyclase